LTTLRDRLGACVLSPVTPSASKVTTARTESDASAASTVNGAIDEFAKKQFVPENPGVCDAAAVPIAVPGGLITDGSVELTCQTQPLSSGNNPQVLLVADATTAAGNHRSIEVLLEVPARQYTTQVNSWIVD
jgi:hypothetical protein